MVQENEPTDSGGAMAVPPELQPAFDEAIEAQRSSTSAPDDAAPVRDAQVSAWEAITRHPAFGSASPVFRAFVFHMVGLAFHLRVVGGARPTSTPRSPPSKQLLPTSQAIPRPGRTTSGALVYALVTRYSQGDGGRPRRLDRGLRGGAEGRCRRFAQEAGVSRQAGCGLLRRFDAGRCPGRHRRGDHGLR